MSMNTTISNLVWQIEVSDCLPPLHRMKFLTNEKYQTGSDYDVHTLQSKVGELEGLPLCQRCAGLGLEWYDNRHGDAEKDVCSICWGSGFDCMQDDDKIEQFRRCTRK